MPEKKRYFKKEKKHLKPTRHKAPAGTYKTKAKNAPKEHKPVIKPHKERKISLRKLQFPRIPRVITESFGKLSRKWGEFEKVIYHKTKKYHKYLTKQHILLPVLGICLVVAIVLGWRTWKSWQNWEKLQQQKVTLQHQLSIWEGIIKQYPTYRDAYFEAAVLAYRLGDRGKEMTYLDSVEQIDPNFKPAFELRKLSR